MDGERLAIFLPTYNEEVSILPVILDLKNKFDGYIFIVDGFSTDNTVKIAKELGIDVFIREHQGKGSAIQKALEIAYIKKIDFLIFFDCDQTYSVEDLHKFLELSHSSDLIIGVRNIKCIKPFTRQLGNIIATKIINITMKGKLKDSISGFKGIRVKSFYGKIDENGFVADALICVIALSKNQRIKLVEIDYFERVGQSKMNLLIGFFELYRLIYSISKILIKKS